AISLLDRPATRFEAMTRESFHPPGGPPEMRRSGGQVGIAIVWNREGPGPPVILMTKIRHRYPWCIREAAAGSRRSPFPCQATRWSFVRQYYPQYFDRRG